MKTNKAYFIQRVVAYIIDIIFITIISSLITMPFVNNNNVAKLNEEMNNAAQNYTEKKIDMDTYVNQTLDISYQEAKETGLSNVISIIVLVLYFVVFQIYNNGQTIGKKLLKIKIVKNDNSELTMNNMIIRELFNSFILVNIIVSVVILFGKNAYFYGAVSIELLQYIFIIVTMFMIMIRKDGRGLPDMMANTKVISSEEN